MNMLRMADLCCGIGGMSEAGYRAGFETMFASEIDPDARDVFEANFGWQPAGDLAGVDPNSVPDHDLMIVGPPCQPFSTAGKRGGFDDGRFSVIATIICFLACKKPAVTVIENVAPLATEQNGRHLRFLLGFLRSLKYKVSWRVLQACDFGAAQTRARVFVVGTRINRRFDFDAVKPTGPGKLADSLDRNIDEGWLGPDEFTLFDRPFHKRSGRIIVGYKHGRLRKPTGCLSCLATHVPHRRVFSVNGLGPTLTHNICTRPLVHLGGRVRKVTINEAGSLMGYPKTFKLAEKTQVAHRQLANSVYVPCVEAVLRAVAEQMFGTKKKETTR